MCGIVGYVGLSPATPVLLKSLKFVGDGLPIAAITFGINSGAYMAEILRGGISAVDYGQTEAGRSLGLSWMATFTKIVHF